MPTLAEWPKVLASAAEAVLSVPEVGYRMPVHDFEPPVFNSLPCVVVESGASGLWVEPSTSGNRTTLSQSTGHFSLRLVVGGPGSQPAKAIVDDATQRLLERFADAVAADPDTGGIRPTMSGEVLTPEPAELAAVQLWYSRLPLTVPLSKLTTIP